MKKFILIIIFLYFSKLNSENNLEFFLGEAIKNNPRLNAERQNLNASKQDISISKSEFLPNLTISGSQSSTQNSNRTNPSGSNLPDTNLDTESKSILVEQKIFEGFQNFNNLKKSKLEYKKANFELNQIENETLINGAEVYFDLILKEKTKKINQANVSLLERQVESDKARLQKGQITLSDLAQSESALAGANAKLIKSDAELENTKTNFKKIIGLKSPDSFLSEIDLNIDLPKSLSESLILGQRRNPQLAISKIDVEIAEKNYMIEKAKLSPKASINYSITEKNDFSSTIDEIEEEKIEAKVSWPLVKGGKNIASIKKSFHKKEQAKLNHRNVENEIKSTITNSWANYLSLKSVLSATKSQLEAAEIANEGITLEYESSNTRTTLDLIQSKSLLLDARISHASAEKEFVISKLKLLKNVGVLDLNLIKTR